MIRLSILGVIGTISLLIFQYLEIMKGHDFNAIEFITALTTIWGSFAGLAIAQSKDKKKDKDDD